MLSFLIIIIRRGSSTLIQPPRAKPIMPVSRGSEKDSAGPVSEYTAETHCGVKAICLNSIHMHLTEIECGERAFFVSWTDHSVTELPFIWLRDNAPGDLHPDTRERVFDLSTVSIGIQPQAYELANDALLVRWKDKAEESVYTSQWLISHQPGRVRQDPANLRRELWTAGTLPEIPRFDASSCTESADLLYEALLAVKRLGLIVFDGLGDRRSAGEDFGDLIGFNRRTNFGVMFEVISKPDPNNLAFTSLALPLHTDLPNQAVVPGYQFLHSYRNNADGGESIFADGFRICVDLEKEEPGNLDLLMHASVPWRFHDDNCDIRYHQPIISQNPNGEFDCFAFNAHIADVPDMETEVLYDFYAVYRNLMKRVRDPRYSLRHALLPGQMVMFDNRRVLHGRAAFDPASGHRHYRGYYIEHNEVDSLIRVLSRELDSNANE